MTVKDSELVMFKGKKINDLMNEIKTTYKGRDYEMEVNEKRNFPLFWMKEYEVEITLIKESEEKTEDAIKKLNKNAFKQKQKNTNEKKQMILDMLEDSKLDSNMKKEAKEGLDSKNIENMQKMMEEMMKRLGEKEQEEKGQEEKFLGKADESVFLHYYGKLIDSEVEEEVAKMIITEVKDMLEEKEWMNKGLVKDRLLDKMKEELQVTGQIDLEENGIVALIGPTGVGKTTTVAKIAGYMKNQNKKIGLITTDVYRIGATDQLQIYANILDSEMMAVNDPEELEAAISKLKHEYKVDQILIDTVGRSPMDIGNIDDIKEYLEIANPNHIGLVLSSTQKTKDVTKILENYSSIDINSLMFTKLDETINHGVMLNAASKNDMKISYITNGQNVPYDIYLAESDAIAKKILNGVDEFGPSIIST